MTISDVSVGGKVTAAKTNEIIADLNSAWNRIQSPTSIITVGTSGSILSSGGVEFTAITELSVNGVFSLTGYPIYEAEVEIKSTSGTITTIVLNGRQAGSTHTGNVYYTYAQTSVAAAAPTGSGPGPDTKLQLQAAGLSGYHFFRIRFHRMIESGAWKFIETESVSTPTTPGATSAKSSKYTVLQTTTATDGFKLTVTGGGDITGRLIVRALNQ